MTLNPKIRNIIIFAGIFIVVIVIYGLFFKGGKEEVPAEIPAESTGQSVSTESEIGKSLLETLRILESLTLDQEFLPGRAFKSLIPSKEEISQAEEADKGRTNPFAPILGSQPAQPNEESAGNSEETLE